MADKHRASARRGRGAGPVLCVAVLLLLLASLTVSPAAAQSRAGTGGGASGGGGSAVQPLKWAVLLDLRRSEMSQENLEIAIQKHISKSTTRAMQRLFANAPMILNSHGDLITALSEVSKIIGTAETFPDVLFLAETTDVSTSVLDVLRQDENTSKILIISAHTSNAKLCDPATNPRTLCMVPRDMINVRGVLDVVSSQLKWYSMAMVYANTGYGQGVQSTVSSQVQEASSTPTVVSELFMNPSSTAAEDDALVAEMMKHKPKGVACFLLAEQMMRLRAAVQRAGLDKTLFLIGSREALNVMGSLVGSLAPPTPAWGALFVSKYSSTEELFTGGYFSNADNVDDYGAYIVSHLFDGMTMVAEAGGAASMAALRAVKFTGFTGTVAFDPIYYQRVATTFSLVMQEYPVSNPLLTWYVQSYSVPPVTVNRNPAAIAGLIPESPLRSVTVCMTSPSTCPDTEMMAAMLAVLLQHNANTSASDTQASFQSVAINTGESGVAGLSALIPVARTCTILTGPGLASVTIAMTPVVNEFEIAQIDYNTANDFFTTETYTYPYFSRTIPANSFNYNAYAELCAHFAWERVIIVSSEDQLGASRAESMVASMEKRNIYVEKTYSLESASIGEINDTLKDIYEKDVSRIILFLLPMSAETAAAFFKLADVLPSMKKYVFLLSKDICLFAAVSPESRKKLPSSLCFFPDVPQERLDLLNQQIAGDAGILQEVKTILSNGKFIAQAETCNVGTVRPFSGFAVDAAYVMIDAVARALASNVSLSSSGNLRRFIRSTTIDKFTGEFTIGANGNRNFAVFVADIQLPDGGVLKVGTWDEKRSPAFAKTYTTPFVWMTGSTAVPLDTFRDYSFVLGSTVSASPGTIVLSVLGFVCTITVFFFCYRHYQMQKLIELTLVGRDVPVTEEELRRLRGQTDDI